MTDNTNHHSAPVPVGDVVPGQVPVPITVWPVPAPRKGDTMSNAMGVRLVHNLTHPGELIIDLADGPQLARAVIAASRRSHLQSARQTGWGKEAARLIVTGWPVDGLTAQEFFTRSRDKLLPGGCVAVLLTHDVTAPVDVIIAAKQAGLSYLQHIVAADQPPRRRQETLLDIHTDVLILRNSTPATGGAR
ncbi:hypothetical protein HDA40_003713 [Hamadaea flava]|uniref:Uncharacterized protein n=1 Tax=Hamadaea flava TaxID=1742688 RepID=A0ABV8LJZ8_9ACTN|nr:hypothetical protein [Hamadaea flava]MCP2325206.1 hypothetical protein [Hamadaea flava]